MRDCDSTFIGPEVADGKIRLVPGEEDVALAASDERRR